jgi:nucleoside 2-deoxyribosyltransferase
MKVYLAGPFFNSEQKRVMGEIESHCLKIGMSFFSPRLNCICPPDATEEVRCNVFRENCGGVYESLFVLARIDDFDPGTVWEMGLAYGVNIPVYAYTTVKGRGLNLMLAQGCEGFLIGLESVKKFLSEVHDENLYTEATRWKNKII